jgi:glycosyltransferase involved in cell wall biosynthesis
MAFNILFLNENPLPLPFTRGSISGKELRLRSAISEVENVIVLSLPGKAVETNDARVGKLEKKVSVFHTIRWPYYLSWLILFMYGFVFVVKYRPKIIEAESPILSGVSAVLLGKLFRVPVLIEVRASYDELIKMKLRFVPLDIKKVVLNFVQRFVFTHASVIVANSKTYQKQIRNIGFDSVVVNPGLQYAPKTIPLKKKRKVIGYLGRLVPEKGVDYLLRACKIIEKDLVKGGWSIEIAGDGPSRLELEKLANELFGKSRVEVRFLGFVNNYEALARFSVLVNPGLSYPPLEMVNVEAAHMHVPVVCFGNKDIPETVIDNKTGVKADSQTITDLARAIKKILTLKFDSKHFKHLADLYSIEIQQQTMNNIYAHYGFLK